MIDPKQYEITYIHRKPKRIVTEAHFARSSAFYPVLQLEVGESIENRYTSAGYMRIKRIL